jgi:hypothetical protein
MLMLLPGKGTTVLQECKTVALSMGQADEGASGRHVVMNQL